MSIFRFKHFQVVNEKSAMKVNTDGVLLGTAVDLSLHMTKILDIGTGTGTIALILAQRLSPSRTPFHIDAIDIDRDSAMEASENFKNSPWGNTLSAHHRSLSEHHHSFAVPSSEQYDLIISNPPYFESSLENPDERTTQARHTKTLSYKDLIDFSAKHLSQYGKLAFILPSGNDTAIVRYAASEGLFLSRKVEIKTVPRKPVSRVIYEFSKEKKLLDLVIFSIQSASGEYSEEYIKLTQDFYLSLSLDKNRK